MHSDHRQPGSTCRRATVAGPRCTTLTIVLSGLRVSSGVSMLLDSTLAIPLSLQPRARARTILADQGLSKAPIGTGTARRDGDRSDQQPANTSRLGRDGI